MGLIKASRAQSLTLRALLVLALPAFSHHTRTVSCGFAAYYHFSRMFDRLCSPPAVRSFFICVLVCMTALQVSYDIQPLSFFYHPIKQTRAQHLGRNAAAAAEWCTCTGLFLCFFGLMERLRARVFKTDRFPLGLDVFMRCLNRVHSFPLRLKYNK